MATRLPFSGEQYWNACKRNAFKGAKMFTYEAGTLTTLKVTYTTADQAVEHPNPILADANGIFPEVYGIGAFYIKILNNAEDELIYEADNIEGQGTISYTQFGALTGDPGNDAVTALGNVGDFVETYEYNFGSLIGEGKYQIVNIDPGNNLINPIKTDGNWLKLIFDGEILSSQFGALGNDTDETAIMQAIRDYVAADPATAITFIEGIYSYSVSPNWAIDNIVVKSSGNVTFRNTGTGDCLIFDNPTTNTYNINFFWESSVFIEGADDTGNGVFWRSCHHSKLGVNIRGCGARAFRSQFAVVNEFNIVSSINEGAFFSATAPDGIYLDERNTGEETSANTFYNPVIEGMRGVGITVDHAIQNDFICGTSEGNAGANVECTVNSRNNAFYKIDLEVSGTSEGLIDAGRFNVWDAIFNDAASTITSDSEGCIIRGGILDSIANAGERTSIENVNYGNQTGELTDTGINTTIFNAYDLESASFKVKNKLQGKVIFSDTFTVGIFAAPGVVPGYITKTNIPFVGVKVGDLIDIRSVTAVSTDFLHPTAIATADDIISISFYQNTGVAVSPLPAGGDFSAFVSGT